LEFTNKRAWRWVEPSPFVSNWHIECMCEHFEAVAHRQDFATADQHSTAPFQVVGTECVFSGVGVGAAS
jgi:hypothetical protein